MNSMVDYEDLRQKKFERIRDIIFDTEGKIINYIEQKYIIKGKTAEKAIDELYSEDNMPNLSERQEKIWINKGVSLKRILDFYTEAKREISVLTG